MGTPGPGKTAPDFTLPSTDGGQVSLADYRRQTVLLYFHEGGGCQPCWDQIRDRENRWGRFRDAGVDELVTITTDPLDLVARKMRDGLSSVALSDPDLAVSQRYTTNQYGMMGETRNGHSFILVGPDGRIQWRADYGGAPEYTMYVAVDDLLADLQAGRRTCGASTLLTQHDSAWFPAWSPSTSTRHLRQIRSIRTGLEIETTRRRRPTDESYQRRHRRRPDAGLGLSAPGDTRSS